MIEVVSLAGLATGTQKISDGQAVGGDWRRITVDRLICSARKKFEATCSACASVGGARYVPDQQVRPSLFRYHTMPSSGYGDCSGKKDRLATTETAA